jgi:hypothetical protein
VVLDHATKSVVVSVRGSVSTADWVTDFLGIPEGLDEWLPDAFKEVMSFYAGVFGCSCCETTPCTQREHAVIRRHARKGNSLVLSRKLQACIAD